MAVGHVNGEHPRGVNGHQVSHESTREGARVTPHPVLQLQHLGSDEDPQHNAPTPKRRVVVVQGGGCVVVVVGGAVVVGGIVVPVVVVVGATVVVVVGADSPGVPGSPDGP